MQIENRFCIRTYNWIGSHKYLWQLMELFVSQSRTRFDSFKLWWTLWLSYALEFDTHMIETRVHLHAVRYACVVWWSNGYIFGSSIMQWPAHVRNSKNGSVKWNEMVRWQTNPNKLRIITYLFWFNRLHGCEKVDWISIMNSERCKRALLISTLFKMIEYARWTPHSDWILFFALNYITDERPKWKPIAIEFQNEHKPHFSQFIFSHCYFQVENVENMYIDSCYTIWNSWFKIPITITCGTRKC